MTTMIEATGIMAHIPTPPALTLPQISASCPESRLPTPPEMKRPTRRQSFSQPVSPKAKPISPITKTKPPLSPTRALKKHIYAATFASHNPRAVNKLAPCPVHCYSSPEQELKVKPSRAVGGVKFSEVPRDVLAPVRTNCPVHVYQEARSTLAQLGSASFARYEERAEPDRCPVHAYATPLSSMRQHSATFGKAVTPRVETATAGPPVHAYSEPLSTLSKGGALFGTSKQGRDAFQRTDRTLAPVHSYAELTSTLRSGGATFGSTPRPSCLAGSLSRTGLVSSSSTPTLGLLGARKTSTRALKPLPKLVPLTEVGVEPAPAAHKQQQHDDGAGSPREVEALLEMPLSS